MKDNIEYIYKELGRKIKALRILNGITQQELGERINKKRSTVATIEQGQQRIQVLTLIDISDALGVSRAFFLR